MKKLIIIVTVIIFGNCYSQSASYDTTFGSSGKVFVNSCSYFLNSAESIALQSDNKIITGSGGYSDIYGEFIRTNSDGSLDTSFGTNGNFRIDSNSTSIIQPNSNYRMIDIAVQNDDKIVSVGFSYSTESTCCVSRINANGGLDTTFNGTGFLELSFAPGASRGNCLKILNNGKILIGGKCGINEEYFSLIRLNSNGSLDTTFGTLGKVLTLMNNQCLPYSIALQADGKIVMGGYVLNNPFNNDYALVRYLSNGSLDTNFGNNGKVITTLSNYGDVIHKVLIQNNGSILVVGNASELSGDSRISMARYLSTGILDTTFATNGVYISTFYGYVDDATLQIDGKIVIGGGLNQTTGYDFAVLRYTTNGALDTDFANSNVSTPYSNEINQCFSLLIQPDNKIVAGGTIYSAALCENKYLGALVRINLGVILGTESFINSDNFVIYPNPTTGIFTIKAPNNTTSFFKVEVINILGQVVYQEKNTLINDKEIDVSNLSTGVYYVSLSNENGMVKKTIVINK